MFVKLLCTFEPQSVLTFLSMGRLSSNTDMLTIAASGQNSGTPSNAALEAPEGYDVRRCIAHCRAAGVVDAEAFLHERLGELDEAGRLYLSEVQR